MAACAGSYKGAIRENPATGAKECPECGRRFDRRDLAGMGRNVPLHSPAFNEDGGRKNGSN
jgi:hypothetical protein